MNKDISNNLKTLLIITAFFVALIPSFVSATQGSCSYHGGVNCSIGPDYDGSVVCNDGWRDSSVLFSNALECREVSTCPAYVSELDYNTLMQQYDSIINQAQKNMQESKRSAEALCISQATQEYRSAQAEYESCSKYKAGLHLLYIQDGGSGVDRSSSVVCQQPKPASDNNCSDIAGPDDLEYIRIIQEAKKEKSCLKVGSQGDNTFITQSGIGQIVDDIKTRTPAEVASDKRKACENDAKLKKEDPVAYQEYKQGLAALGIPATDCDLGEAKDNTLVKNHNETISDSEEAFSWQADTFANKEEVIVEKEEKKSLGRRILKVLAWFKFW